NALDDRAKADPVVLFLRRLLPGVLEVGRGNRLAVAPLDVVAQGEREGAPFVADPGHFLGHGAARISDELDLLPIDVDQAGPDERRAVAPGRGVLLPSLIGLQDL